MRCSFAIAALVALAASAGAASAQSAPQTPPPAQTPAPPAPRPAVRPRPVNTQVIVRDVSGTALAGVKVTMSGPASQEVSTDANGTASLGVLKDGTYHFQFEREGFVTLERDVAVRAGQPAEIYAALRLAPVVPPPPPPEPPPAPPPPAASASGAAGPPVFVSIPQFIDKNYIGREPLKESVLGCLASSTTRLLQLHDPIAEHTHADMDEILYVVAGEGTVRARGDATMISAGSLSVLPRGLPHAIEKRGRNPLILLSIVSGAPCRAASTAVAASGASR